MPTNERITESGRETVGVDAVDLMRDYRGWEELLDTVREDE
jgi:hypothetical protein